MKAEREEKERLDKERLLRGEKIKDQFADPNGQWEKDKADIQNEAIKEKANAEKAAKNQAAAQNAADDDDEVPKKVAAGPAKIVAGPAKPQEKT
jgi:mannan polymerase II complex ANP1 subunit